MLPWRAAEKSRMAVCVVIIYTPPISGGKLGEVGGAGPTLWRAVLPHSYLPVTFLNCVTD